MEADTKQSEEWGVTLAFISGGRKVTTYPILVQMRAILTIIHQNMNIAKVSIERVGLTPMTMSGY